MPDTPAPIPKATRDLAAMVEPLLDVFVAQAVADGTLLDALPSLLTTLVEDLPEETRRILLRAVVTDDDLRVWRTESGIATRDAPSGPLPGVLVRVQADADSMQEEVRLAHLPRMGEYLTSEVLCGPWRGRGPWRVGRVDHLPSGDPQAPIACLKVASCPWVRS